MRVLLVEDDPGLAAIIKTGFAEHGVQVVTVANYAEGKTKAKVLSKTELGADAQQLGREYFIFGSPAISDGRIYLQTAAGTYCIGPKEIKKQMVDSIDKLRQATKTLRTKVDNFDVNNAGDDELSSLSEDFDSFGSDFESNGDKFDSAFSDASDLSKASKDSEVCKALSSDFSS